MSIWKFSPGGTLTALSPDVGGDAGVWVPSERITFCRAELPPGRQNVWEQTVGFALEEQLIAPVDEQHFAIGHAGDSDVGVPVAVISTREMEAWFEDLREKNLKPKAIWPDVLAVPFEEGRAVVWHENERCLLRLGRQNGVVGSPEWVATMLEVSGQTGVARVFSDAAEALPEALRERAEPLPGSFDERMLEGPDEGAAAMNLLQGLFRPVSAIRAWGAPWRWAAAAVAAVFALHLAGLAAEIRIMDAAVASLKEATVELYKQHFPEQELVSDLRAQVERRMSQVQGGVVKRETSPWQALARIEPAISSCKACRVEELNLKGASVSLIMSSSATFDELLRKIRKLDGVKVSSKPLPDDRERKQLRLELTLGKVG